MCILRNICTNLQITEQRGAHCSVLSPDCLDTIDQINDATVSICRSDKGFTFTALQGRDRRELLQPRRLHAIGHLEAKGSGPESE